MVYIIFYSLTQGRLFSKMSMFLLAVFFGLSHHCGDTLHFSHCIRRHGWVLEKAGVKKNLLADVKQGNCGTLDM